MYYIIIEYFLFFNQYELTLYDHLYITYFLLYFIYILISWTHTFNLIEMWINWGKFVSTDFLTQKWMSFLCFSINSWLFFRFKWSRELNGDDLSLYSFLTMTFLNAKFNSVLQQYFKRRWEDKYWFLPSSLSIGSNTVILLFKKFHNSTKNICNIEISLIGNLIWYQFQIKKITHHL